MAALSQRGDALLTAAARVCFNRWAPVRAAQGPFQEWIHFCIHVGDVDLLVNYSLEDSGSFPRRRRVVLLRRDGWRGDVSRIEDGDVEWSGRFGCTFAADRVSMSGAGIDLDIDCAALGLRAQLRLTPRTLPSVTHNSRYAGANPIHWLVIPHLRADGVIRVREETLEVRQAPAYHDHNWGSFCWGEDFAWEWIYSVPRDEDTWSAIAVRLSDRSHGRVYSQGLLVWDGPRLARIFRADEVRFERLGLLRSDRPPAVFPVAAALLRPGRATDLPARFRAIGESRGDRAELTFDVLDAARIVVPNRGDGVTVIHEASGGVRLAGEVAGRPVASRGAGMLERLGN